MPVAISSQDTKVHYLSVTENALKAGDLEKATYIATEAIRQGYSHALFYNLRAYALEQQGRLEEALSDLNKAASLDPADAMVQNALGLCLTRLERWQDALAAFRKAIHLAPDFHLAHFNLATTLERTGRLDDARGAYIRTHELDPNAAPPLAYLAALASRRAAWTEAEEWAEKALQRDPKSHLAITAQIRVALASADHKRAEERLDTLLSDTTTPPVERTVALNLKGDLRHSQKRYAQAFAAYAQGNAEQRALFAPTFERPDGVTAYNYTRWLRDYFVTTEANWRITLRPGPTGDESGHTFLMGFPRSGTTLLENVLASNPAIVSLEEKPVLTAAVRAYLTQDGGPDRLAKADEHELDSYRRDYWKRVGDYLSVTGLHFIDKEPLSTIKLPVIAKLFPGAKILFAIRDPRDVVLSCFRRQFNLNPSMYELLTLEGAAKFYASVMELGELYREKLGLDWYVVRHEALVEDFEGETRKVCAYLGVDWTEKMRHFAEHARNKQISTPSALQVMKGLNRDGMAQWRHYAKELEPALPHLMPWVEKFGYQKE